MVVYDMELPVVYLTECAYSEGVVRVELSVISLLRIAEA